MERVLSTTRVVYFSTPDPGPGPQFRYVLSYDLSSDEAAVDTAATTWKPPSDRQAFRPELMAGALPGGGVAYSDSSAYAIKFTAPGGRVTRIVTRPFRPRPIQPFGRPPISANLGPTIPETPCTTPSSSWSSSREPQPTPRSRPAHLDNGIISAIMNRRDILAALKEFRTNPKGVRFRDLARVCDACFGEPRQRSGSHRVYRTPWPGDPRVNIQSAKGMAKAYQVRQVIRAIEKLETLK